MRYPILCGLLLATLPAGAVTLVDGPTKATLIVPDEATDVAQYAAAELADHLSRATGVDLPIQPESQAPTGPKVYLGPCRATAEAGIDLAKLEPEEFRILATAEALYLVGGDSEGPALNQNIQAGTLYAVYELLETELGVHWLWPGELGRVVPQTDLVVIQPQDREVKPWLIQRRLRAFHRPPGQEAANFTKEGYQRYIHDEAVFLRRHRMGRTKTLRYGHAFESWWKTYGDEHPDYFQLLENGQRGPASPHARFSMCVSNPALHQQIIDNWLKTKAANPDEFVNINGCENDIRGSCTCPDCLAWDGPQPEHVPDRFGPRVVSDRYARFWLALQQLGAKSDPDATVIGYAYVNYAPPPSPGLKLNDHIYVGTVPDLFFPRTPDEQQWVKDQWEGWSRTGCKLFLRPNYMLDGYAMPHIIVHQFADEFRFEAQHGMVYTDFDSLTGQWATQGPNLYVLARLHTRPEQTADELLAEYYAAFGAAAKQVQAYFDYYEQFVTENELLASQMSRWSQYAGQVQKSWTPEVLDHGQQLLDQALAAVKGDQTATARVEFLRQGLQHARLCLATAQAMSGDTDRYPPLIAGKAMAALADFRHSTEAEDVANFSFCAWQEGRCWNLSQGFNGEPLKALSAEVEPLAEGLAFPGRGQQSYVALLQPGESFTAKLKCRQVGRYEDNLDWSLYGPDGLRVAQGSLAPKSESDLSQPVQAGGTYVLSVSSGRNGATVTPTNDHVAVASRTLSLITDPGRLWFYVPANTKQFTVELFTSAPGETAASKLYDPDDNVVDQGQTGGKEPKVVFDVKVPKGLDGKAWSVETGKAETGVLEDYKLTLGLELPPYWSLAGDRLVVPE